MNVPKPDQRLIDSIARLRNNHDFQAFQKHMADLETYLTDQLVKANVPLDVPLLQGRIRQLSDLSKLLKDNA